MPTLIEDQPHSHPTERSEFEYLFTRKHHGGDTEAATWVPSLSLEEEFSVFNIADSHEISENGKYYGIGRRIGDSLQILGTCKQQMAIFPNSRPGEVWHGYPLWSIDESAPENRRKEKSMRPGKLIFQRLVRVHLLTEREKKRLMGGKHV